MQKMMLSLVQSRDSIFVKGYGFLFFVENMGSNISKNRFKSLSGKCSQKRFPHVQLTDALNLLQKKWFKKW